jgi:hypothetical protein
VFGIDLTLTLENLRLTGRRINAMMRVPQTLTRSLLLLLLCLSISAEYARAQSTVVNTPSTDIVSKKDVYLEFDYISNYSHHYKGGFQTYVPRAVVGVGKGVEVGANVSYTDGFGVNQPVEIQPNIKWRFYESEANGMAATVGCIGYVPVTHRTGSDTFAMCYSVVSKRLKGNYGPRFTGGGYALLHRADGAGSKGGGIAAYEQPIASRASFVVDWFTGHNRFGYVTPGFMFIPTSRSTLFTGYSIGNQGRRNNAFMAFYGMRL